MLNNCAKFHENQTCSIPEITANVTNQRTNKHQQTRMITMPAYTHERSQNFVLDGDKTEGLGTEVPIGVQGQNPGGGLGALGLGAMLYADNHCNNVNQNPYIFFTMGISGGNMSPSPFPTPLPIQICCGRRNEIWRLRSRMTSNQWLMLSVKVSSLRHTGVIFCLLRSHCQYSLL